MALLRVRAACLVSLAALLESSVGIGSLVHHTALNNCTDLLKLSGCCMCACIQFIFLFIRGWVYCNVCGSGAGHKVRKLSLSLAAGLELFPASTALAI